MYVRVWQRVPRSSLAARIHQRRKKRFSIQAVILEKQLEAYIGPEQLPYGSSFVLRRSLFCEKIKMITSLKFPRWNYPAASIVLRSVE